MVKHVFVSSTESSVFNAVAKLLSSHPNWKESGRKDPFSCQLWLGDGRTIGAIPYERLESRTTVVGASSSSAASSSSSSSSSQQSAVRLVNYIRGLNRITLKSMLVRTISTYCEECEIDPRTVVPESFVVYPVGTPGRDERHLLLRSYERDKENGVSLEDVWIAKSSAGGKGENIQIARDPRTLFKKIDTGSIRSAWVVQRYITNPLLINGRKFDIRVWVLVDSEYTPHIFSEGVLRTASKPFDLSNLSDHITHLTNHCIQETSPLYSQFEEGNELSFAQFDAYLRANCGGARFDTHVLPQIRSTIALSLEAARRHATIKKGKLASFQLLGFDFMLDADLNLKLIEANGSPASRALLLPHMAKDIIHTVIDTTFPTTARDHTEKPLYRFHPMLPFLSEEERLRWTRAMEKGNATAAMSGDVPRVAMLTARTTTPIMRATTPMTTTTTAAAGRGMGGNNNKKSLSSPRKRPASAVPSQRSTTTTITTTSPRRPSSALDSRRSRPSSALPTTTTTTSSTTTSSTTTSTTITTNHRMQYRRNSESGLSAANKEEPQSSPKTPTLKLDAATKRANLPPKALTYRG